MDFDNMNRKELQALCKKHNIPANLSNSQMALKLSSLLQEREKPTKRGRASSKASVETVEEKESSITTRQAKKVRFSPTNETFDYVELRSGRKDKTKVTQTKSSMKPAARSKGKSVEKVDIKSNKEVAGKTVRSLRSRVQETVEGGIIPVINPPVEIKRGRRVGKDAVNAEPEEKIVIKPVRITRSRGQTSSEGDSVPVQEQRVGKKRGRGRAVENVDRVEPVEDIVSVPVRTTRSRAQISQEGGKPSAFKPKVEKEISARGKAIGNAPSKDTVDSPVRTTRSRAQTSKEGDVNVMPNLLIEKKRASKRSKVGDATVESTVEVLDSSDKVVSRKAASVQAEDLQSKRSLRNRESGGAVAVQRKNVVAPQAAGRNANRRKSIMPQKTENENVVPHTGPLRRSHRPTSLLEPTVSTDEDLASPVVNGRNRSGKQSHAVSSGNAVATAAGNNTAKKQRGNLNISKPVIDIQDAHSVEESSRRFTRTATKIFVDNSSNKRSVLRSTRSSKQEGVKEIFAQPSILEQAKRQTPLSKSKKLQTDRGEKEEISSRKRRGDHLLKEDSIENSPKQATRSATKHEFVKDRTSTRSTKSNRSTRSLKQGEVKGQLSSSISRKSDTDGRQVRKGISGRKERGGLTFEGKDVGMRFTSPAEESSRRVTRSAFKSNSNAAANRSGKSVDKRKFKNQAKTPSQEVKTPSSDSSPAIHGVATINNAQFSRPEAVESASGPVMEVISGISTEMGKKVSANACALKGDGTEEVCAQISSISKGKDQASDLEEELASESERLLVDDIEAENVGTVKETTMITETVIASGGPTHAINEIANSTPFSNPGLPNLEKIIPVEGTSTNSIEIMPEVLASAIEQSIEIEHTSGQEIARQFTNSAGKSESEFRDIEIEVPIEEGSSALEGALDIAAVPEVLEEAVRPVLSSSDALDHSISSHIKISSTESHVNEKGSSQEVYAETLSLDETKRQDQKETEVENSVDGAVDVAENVNIVLGDDKEKSCQCSDETVNEHGPGSHFLKGSGISGSSELADQQMEEELSVPAGDGFDETPSTAIGCLPADQSHSLSKAQEMQEQSMDAQPSLATSDVFARDDLHAFDQTGGSRENDEDIFQDAGRANEDDTNLIKDGNHDVEETENNMEFAKPHEFSSSPARQTKELEMMFETSSFGAKELPSQLADVIGTDNTPSRISEEPLESFDATVGASASTSFSIKQKTSVKVCTGPALNESIDLVAMDLEKAPDLNLEKLQSEHKTLELDLALEENSVDFSHNSDNDEIAKSPTSGAVVSDIVGSDDSGFENKLEPAASKDDFPSCQDEQIYVESSALGHDAHSPKSVGNISGSQSYNREKNSGDILDMNDYDGKVSDTGVHTDDSVTGSVNIANLAVDKNIPHGLPTHDNSELGTTSKKASDHSFDVEKFYDTVPAEESQNKDLSSKENQLQVTREEMTGGIHSEGEAGFQLQKITETPVPKDVQECNDTVPLEESQHEDLHCKDNQSQSDEDYQLQKFFDSPVSKDVLETEDRVPQEEGQPENGPNTEDQMLTELGEGNARLSSCEDINYGELWNDENTLATFFATPASSSISSKNARSYFPEKMEGLEQDIKISGGSHSVDAGRYDLKEAILKEKARTFKDTSGGLLFSNNVIIEEDHCNSSIGCQTSHELLYSTEEIASDQPAEKIGSSCNLIDADHNGEDRKQESEMKMDIKASENSTSVSAEEQPGQPEDSMKQISFGPSDISIIHEDDDPSMGFDEDGDTEQYFHSDEHTGNADFEIFGGNTQELLDEVAEMSGHDYSALNEPGMNVEDGRKEAENSALIEDDIPMIGGNGEEKEKEQLDEAHSISDQNTKTNASTDMGSRTEPPSVSDDFTTDEVD